MIGRRALVALLLLGTISVLALPTGLDAPGLDLRAPGPGTDSALGGLRWPGLEPAVVRLNAERHAEPGPARQSHRAGLFLLAVLALLAATPGPGRAPAPGATGATARLAWWWPVIGRAPPVTTLIAR